MQVERRPFDVCCSFCLKTSASERLFEVWHPQRPLLVDVARSLLEEQSLSVRKALSELIVVMASHCYLVGPSGELFVEYLVRHAAVEEIDNLKVRPDNIINYLQNKV